MTDTRTESLFPTLAYETAPDRTAARTHAAWHSTPAEHWVEALALGNGTLGAMSYGGILGSPTPGGERLQVNHAAAWSGSPASAHQMPVRAEEGPALLASARSALAAGDVRSAEATLQRMQSPHTQAFLPFVDLTVEVRAAQPQPDAAHPAAYVRWLCLATGRAGHEYPVAGTQGRVRHSTWTSRPHDVLVHTVYNATSAPVEVAVDLASRLRVVTAVAPPFASESTGQGMADHRGALAASVTVELPVDVAPMHEEVDEHVRYDSARARHGVAVVASRVEDATGAPVTSSASGPSVHLAPGQRLVLVLAAGITARPGDLDDAREVGRAALHHARHAVALGSPALYEAHRAAHTELYDRVALVLGVPGGRVDEDLDRAALVFHLGRYLLVAGYRPGASPLTLQGLWNDELPAPWSSNYTLNINTEMNYWAAETANLAECHVPLLDWVAAASRGTGEVAARTLYGARGWVLHHNSDRWGHAAPVGAGAGDVSWSFWPLGGVWLTRHLWDHVDFSGTTEPGAAGAVTADLAYLREVWPVIESCAAFALDWIVPDPARGAGATQTTPSTSPENRFVAADGRPASATTSSTMDVALLRDLAVRCRAAAAALGVAPAWLGRLDAAVAGLPDPRTGSRGELLEWSAELVEVEPEHRHTSHLVGVYPLGQITPEGAPVLAAAARRTLELRGPESTGWALAWRVALWARLHDAEQAHATLQRCLRPVPPDSPDGPAQRGGLYPNLFSAHPPFQIDGNLGYAAGVIEMLLQSHSDGLHLLPALPTAWPDGSVRGLRARGGIVVDIVWAEGRLTRATLRSAASAGTTPAGAPMSPVRVRCGSRRVVVQLAPGAPLVLDGDLHPTEARQH